nr:PREDICTED: golgin subfamily A member 6-like protein 2 isoform X1 [Bemisia tabaci]
MAQCPSMPFGAELPSKRRVLERFLSHLRDGHTLRQSAERTVDHFAALWKESHVRTEREELTVLQVEKLFEEWLGLYEMAEKHRREVEDLSIVAPELSARKVRELFAEMLAIRLKANVFFRRLDDLFDVAEERNFYGIDVKVEEKKGGIKFELIESPANTPPPKTKSSSPTRTISSENIDEKLKAAAERRLSLEAKKIEQLSNQLSKIEHAMKKRDEISKEFSVRSKKVLEEKMEQYSEKKEAHISEVLCKLKKQFENGEKTRQSLESALEEIKENTNLKLLQASKKRESQIQELTKRLKEHDEHAKSVYNALKEKQEELKQRILTKEEEAALRKEQKIKEKLEKLKEKDNRSEKVRQNKTSESCTENGTESPASG